MKEKGGGGGGGEEKLPICSFKNKYSSSCIYWTLLIINSIAYPETKSKQFEKCVTKAYGTSLKQPYRKRRGSDNDGLFVFQIVLIFPKVRDNAFEDMQLNATEPIFW